MESNNVDGLPGFGPLREATVFLDYLKGFPSPSQAEKVVYPLKEVLLLSLLANAESFTDISRFGEKKLVLLRRFLPYFAY